MQSKLTFETASIQVICANSDQEAILANLLELYAHDFSEFHDLELGIDGRFGYKHLRLYWCESNRHAFLLRVDGNLAGFALVKKGSEISGNETIWDMAEFFVVRKYRRRGIGTEAAHEVWRRFPGAWEIRVMESNPSAQRFWERVIGAFVGEEARSIHVEKSGKRWRVFSFESKHTAKRPNSMPTA